MNSPCGVSTTTGRLRMASVDRIATCGTLMIGAVNSVPNAPLLVIVVGAAAHVVGRHRAGARLVHLPQNGFRQPFQRELVGAMHHRNHEPLVRQIDRDAEMDVARYQQAVAVEACIDLRKIANGQTRRARDERQIGQRCAGRRF